MYSNKQNIDRKNSMKRIIAALLTPVIIFLYFGNAAYAEEIALDISAPSVILMEASTGQVIYEKNSEERLHPASVTKVMTLLLIFEALDAGKIKLTDEVVTSAHAKSMGGSQVFLEEGEIQTVDTLIKCIAVASGNDASVAMAEHIAGSEEEFVKLMNQRAKELGMVNTSFEDCCGLSDSKGHMTTAKDIALMSRELTVKHPEIFDYTKIWMEDITHVTAKETKNFTLSSTNKLLKQYEYATGLKTGSTSVAKYCLSATATKDNIHLIAVIMKAPDYKVRFKDAIKLLNYGFSVSKVYKDENKDNLGVKTVVGGVESSVPITYAGTFQYLDISGKNMELVKKEIKVPETVTAPIKMGDKAGEAVYTLDGNKIGSVDILYGANVEKAVYKDYVWKVIVKLLL